MPKGPQGQKRDPARQFPPGPPIAPDNVPMASVERPGIPPATDVEDISD